MRRSLLPSGLPFSRRSCSLLRLRDLREADFSRRRRSTAERACTSSTECESYFPAIKEEFALAGKEVEIQLKHKGRPSSVESAFLKESSEVFRIGFTTQKQIKVKIEVDIDPPPGFSTEQKLLVKPVSRWIRVYSIGDLFACKVSAALFRAWRTRTKGRDWYDLEWYVRNGYACHLGHLVERCKESAPERRCPSVPEGHFMPRHLEPGVFQFVSRYDQGGVVGL